MGVLSALGTIKAPQETPPPWEIAPGIVDYSKVPEDLSGPTPNVLKVAQWYDYWPGSFITDFIDYMKAQYNKTVDVQVSIYTSNEDLFTWITLGRQQFDVFFPSNYVVDLMKHSNMVYTLNPDWIPNLQNLGPAFVGVPAGNPFDMRTYAGQSYYVSIPYFWGTTGVGWRTDKIPRQDVEQLGFEFLWKSSYTPSDPSYPPLDLVKRMRMLDDERDVLGWGFKKAGWESQKEQGLTPTGNSPPQWTTNETDTARLRAAGDQLFAAKPNLFDFNSTEDATSLVSGTSYLNQAWSGDIMYAKRPDQNVALPVDYLIPIQGSTWWIDCAAIHSKSRNLWLAHQFLNFTQDVREHMILTKWNLYSTPNQRVYEQLLAQPFPNGWNMGTDPILYPNVYDPTGWARCDMSSDPGLAVLINEYNPLWFNLTAV